MASISSDIQPVLARGPSNVPVRTIHDLPVELLMETFVIVAALVHKTPSPTSWMRLLLVCKHWCKVACDTSALWRVIHVGSNLDWLRVCLLRTQHAQIDLHLNSVPQAAVSAAVPLIAPHADRIRALHVHGHNGIEHNGDRPNGVLQLCTLAMPALEELSVLPAAWRSKTEVSLGLSAETHPHIRALALSGVSIPRSPAFYGKMRSLRLHECCCVENEFTFGDLVRALHAASGTLETLDLSRFAPVDPRDTASEQADDEEQGLPKTVALPHLRSLYLENEFAFTARLLKALTLPLTAALHLRVPVEWADRQRYLTGAALLAALIPPNTRALLESTKALVLDMSSKAYRINAMRTPPEHDAAALEMASDSGDGKRKAGAFARQDVAAVHAVVDTHGWSSAGVDPGLRGILATHTTGQLRHLSVRYLEAGGRSAEVTVREWTTVLGAFPLLETLAVRGRYWTLREALNALTPSGGGGEVPLCPLLRVLRFESDMGNGEALCEALVSFVQARAGGAGGQRGGFRLRELVLYCKQDSGVRDEALWRARLEQWVDAVRIG